MIPRSASHRARSRAALGRVKAALLTLSLFAFLSRHAFAQTARTDVDVLTFTNGDQLTGKVLKESAGSVTFESAIGKVVVPWTQIKNLRTSETFAVITKGDKLHSGRPAPQVPVGTIALSPSTVAVTGTNGEIKEVPAADTAYIVNDAEFEKLMHHEQSFREGWQGSGTLAAAVIDATQTSKTFTGAIGLVKTVPGVEWLAPRNKTIFDASLSYGSATQPAVGTTPASSTKTDIFHADLEHDWYLSSRFFGLVDAAADHNLGSGLKLQQLYGGGAGYSVIRRSIETLDIKGDIHFERQDFYPASLGVPGVSLNLIGIDLGEVYIRRLAHGLTFNESGMVQPAFNHPTAFTALVTAGLVFPVYKNFGFSLGTQDNYINNPPSGYKGNTFQFTAGLNYAFK